MKLSGNGSAEGSALQPERSSAETVVRSSAEVPAGSSPQSPGSSSASSPATSAASSSTSGLATFPPLIVERFGKSVRVKRAAKNRRIWAAEDFGRRFLKWLETIDPKFRNGRVCVPDIETDFLPRFKVAARCPNLKLGTLLRGLGNVTAGKYDDVPYLDPTGKPRTMTEYEVQLKPSMVDLAAVERRRA